MTNISDYFYKATFVKMKRSNFMSVEWAHDIKSWIENHLSFEVKRALKIDQYKIALIDT